MEFSTCNNVRKYHQLSSGSQAQKATRCGLHDCMILVTCNEHIHSQGRDRWMVEPLLKRCIRSEGTAEQVSDPTALQLEQCVQCTEV